MEKKSRCIWLHMVIVALMCTCACASRPLPPSLRVPYVSDTAYVDVVNMHSVFRAFSSSPGRKVLEDAWLGGTVKILIAVDREAQYICHDVISSPHPLVTEAVTAMIPIMKFAIIPGKSAVDKEEYLFMLIVKVGYPTG